MTATVLRFGGPVLPWRNGDGHTREIARAPTGEPFDWRVSIAEVAEASQFSAYPGVDRIIVLCEGQAMTIVVDGTEHILRHHVPFAFAGESATSCRLIGGPTRDLNVMTRRGRCTAEVSVCRVNESGLEIADRRLTLVVALTGTYDIRMAAPDDPIALEVFDAVLLERACGLRIAGHGAVAVILIDTEHTVESG